MLRMDAPCPGLDSGTAAGTAAAARPSAFVQLYGTACAWRLPLAPGALRQRLAALLAAAFRLRPAVRPFGVEMLLVRDGEMAAHNAESMGCAGPTNILSFPAETANEARLYQADGLAAGDAPLASLILSVDAVHREALLFHLPPRDHLLRLLAHGIGHLMGFQHSPEMFTFCDNILLLQDKYFFATNAS